MTEPSGFVPLLVPRDNTELELAKGLLEGAEIPFAVGTSDRVELLEVFSDVAAEGLHVVLVPADRREEAAQLLLEAWGPDVFEPWTPPASAAAESEEIEYPEFVPLLLPKDNVELELGRGLLEGAGIPVAVGASDQVELLQVLEGSSAAGLTALLVPVERLDDAVAVLEEAWGPDTFSGRDPRPPRDR